MLNECETSAISGLNDDLILRRGPEVLDRDFVLRCWVSVLGCEFRRDEVLIYEELTRDHERLKALMDRIRETPSHARATLRERIEVFQSLLNSHIRAEEAAFYRSLLQSLNENRNEDQTIHATVIRALDHHQEFESSLSEIVQLVEQSIHLAGVEGETQLGEQTISQKVKQATEPASEQAAEQTTGGPAAQFINEDQELWRRKFMSLQQTLENHFELEEKDLFHLAQKIVSRDEADEMGALFDGFIDGLADKTADKTADKRPDQRAEKQID